MTTRPPLILDLVDPWPDEVIERLKVLWKEGASASEIARDLGMGKTRNAVIGKVHRLKLEKRPNPNRGNGRVRKDKPPKPRKAPKVARLSVSFPLAKPVLPDSFEPAPWSDPKPLMETTGCMWPIGDHGLFCNAGRETGSHYCPHHHAKAYRKAA